ncbi:hypothetical protein HNQ96_003077 [Aminobacter lissarensis]|uniref:Uncharacterized protein n=1 Tax=Aminobacter carboxidus TaxID=376165 RepID=A0A8E2BCQ5_9HYPH|nr:hypothetical protein [Aminobacter lissarensis]
MGADTPFLIRRVNSVFGGKMRRIINSLGGAMNSLGDAR